MRFRSSKLKAVTAEPAPAAETPGSRNTYTAELRRAQTLRGFEQRAEVAGKVQQHAPEAAFASLMRKPAPAPAASQQTMDLPTQRRRRARWWTVGLLVVVLVQLALLQLWSRLLGA